MKKSFDRVIAQEDLPGYNKTRKPDQQESRGASGRNKLAKILLLVLCIIAMIVGGYQRVKAQPAEKGTEPGASLQQKLDRVSSFTSSDEPGGAQGDYQISERTQPGIWFGLAATLTGTLVLWMSVILLARRTVY